MNAAVWVEWEDGQYTARLYGSTKIEAVGDSKDAAIAALVSSINQDRTNGELVFVDLPVVGVSDLASVARSPEEVAMWQEIKEEAYRLRDEQKRAEFGE